MRNNFENNEEDGGSVIHEDHSEDVSNGEVYAYDGVGDKTIRISHGESQLDLKASEFEGFVRFLNKSWAAHRVREGLNHGEITVRMHDQNIIMNKDDIAPFASYLMDLDAQLNDSEEVELDEETEMEEDDILDDSEETDEMDDEDGES